MIGQSKFVSLKTSEVNVFAFHQFRSTLLHELRDAIRRRRLLFKCYHYKVHCLI